MNVTKKEATILHDKKRKDVKSHCLKLDFDKMFLKHAIWQKSKQRIKI